MDVKSRIISLFAVPIHRSDHSSSFSEIPHGGDVYQQGPFVGKPRFESVWLYCPELGWAVGKPDDATFDVALSPTANVETPSASGKVTWAFGIDHTEEGYLAIGVHSDLGAEDKLLPVLLGRVMSSAEWHNRGFQLSGIDKQDQDFPREQRGVSLAFTVISDMQDHINKSNDPSLKDSQVSINYPRGLEEFIETKLKRDSEAKPQGFVDKTLKLTRTCKSESRAGTYPDDTCRIGIWAMGDGAEEMTTSTIELPKDINDLERVPSFIWSLLSSRENKSGKNTAFKEWADEMNKAHDAFDRDQKTLLNRDWSAVSNTDPRAIRTQYIAARMQRFVDSLGSEGSIRFSVTPVDRPSVTYRPMEDAQRPVEL